MKELSTSMYPEIGDNNVRKERGQRKLHNWALNNM
jgi:hypothetical protein